MPEWLTPAVHGEPAITLESLTARLVIALLSGICVAVIYRASHGRESRDASTLATTIVLLAVLIAMVTMVIGSSVARAFSLVGALSIVRFRTVVDDTRDTAYVIFAVIVGMAAGSASFQIPLVGIPLVGSAAFVMSLLSDKRTSRAPGRCTLVVRVGIGRDPDALIGGVLDRHLEKYRAVATSSARQGAAIELTYVVQLRSLAAQTALVIELNQTEGVQGVELRQS